MARSERLLTLLQVLRRYQRPVSGASLAHELGISIRTLYRDIATLQAQGAAIDGEAGVGYVMRPGFMLPPLMFSQTELEALVLGFRWVGKYADVALTDAATDALAKIGAVLPPEMREALETNTLLVGPRTVPEQESVDLTFLRRAMRSQHKLRIAYRDANDVVSQRVIWPFALGYFQTTRILAGWCETRRDFRHFRTERILTAEQIEQRYPRSRAALLRSWREARADLFTPDRVKA